MLSDYHCDIQFFFFFRLLDGVMTESKPAVEFMAGDVCPDSALSRIKRSNTELPENIFLGTSLYKIHAEGSQNGRSENVSTSTLLFPFLGSLGLF